MAREPAGGRSGEVLWRGLDAFRTLLAGLFDRGAEPDAHPFDRRHGVDTGGLIYAPELVSGHPHDEHSAGYYATAPSLFHGAIDLWRGTLNPGGPALEDYALVDIGCGKGRVVMMAGACGFREVMGVELNPMLARVARKNLRRWMRRSRACKQVRIEEGDVLATPLPEGPVVLFYFNSFEREMARRWFASLEQAAAGRTTPIDVIYIHPEFGGLLERMPGVKLAARKDIPFTPEDSAADAFGVVEDGCAVYRISPRE